jgi:uncharacterized protein
VASAPHVPPPLPQIDDELFAPFWQAASEHRLEVRRCRRCGTLQWPPRPLCARCRSADLGWHEIGQLGTVFSYFVAWRAFHPAFADDVPYAVGVVELEEGVRMLGRITGIDPKELRIGMAVQASFEQRGPGVHLVYWRPRADAG